MSRKISTDFTSSAKIIVTKTQRHELILVTLNKTTGLVLISFFTYESE